jgi:VIT1/CCC1 family predicted Fe2+/Mn2+ transporter
MGIGGYLAALDELPSKSSQPGDGDEEELKGMLHSATDDSDDGRRESSDEKSIAQKLLVLRHLEPLELPASTVAGILASLREQSGRLDRAATQLESRNNDALCQQVQPLPIWPVASGLSISLGYVIGGIIPLLPYFFAATVGLGLRWSIGMCLVALMAFGSGKSWVLGGEDANWKRSVWSGVQMLVLGSLAAGAAVLCVQLVGGS